MGDQIRCSIKFLNIMDRDISGRDKTMIFILLYSVSLYYINLNVKLLALLLLR